MNENFELENMREQMNTLKKKLVSFVMNAYPSPRSLSIETSAQA